MRRDDSVRGVPGVESCRFLEQPKHGGSGHCKRAEAIISSQALEFEQALVERRGALDVIHMDRGFDDAVDLHRGLKDPSISSNAFGKRAARSALWVTTTRIVFDVRLISSNRPATCVAVRSEERR